MRTNEFNTASVIQPHVPPFSSKLFVCCVGCFQFHCSAMYLQKSFRAAVLKDKDHLVGKPTTECLAVSKTACFQIFPDMALLCHFWSNWVAQKKENHEDLISGMMEGSAKGFGVVWSEERGAQECGTCTAESPRREKQGIPTGGTVEINHRGRFATI